MIRPDVANRLQPTADLTLRPASPGQEITDKLSGLVVGQRLLAEIQSLLPNGSYRALINQRSITLALPFAARSGDAIELEVAESNGKLTLAVLAKAVSDSGQRGVEAAATSLSRTGQLISDLLGGTRNAGPVALPLNGNQPIAARPPANAQELLPLLKQAISESGMFYESHQAGWVEGRYSKAQLLQEPQGKLLPLVTVQQAAVPRLAATLVATAQESSRASEPRGMTGATGEAAQARPADPNVATSQAAPLVAAPPDAAAQVTVAQESSLASELRGMTGAAGEAAQARPTDPNVATSQAAPLLQEPEGIPAPVLAEQQTTTPRLAPPPVVTVQESPQAAELLAVSDTAVEANPAQARPADPIPATSQSAQSSQTPQPPPSAPPSQPVAPQAQAIVQQQLEAFATQNFSWQGQIWPGQQIRWEIANEIDPRESRGDGAADSGENSEKWQTRLRLTLPQLGEVDARLHIQGKQITLAVVAPDAGTRARLRSEVAALRSQFEQAGLDLASLGITAPPASIQPAQ
ncbi:flagellar hook-length control protein FliK [Candidatus Accumulibacter vicinus]|uniref:Flagellar hook-length control protein FliK n=1 Tax=Candidatus Accumulibacter vicinus TaxID=2954382 RepID=A0A084XWV4_9PROT|nr:flagellar hook-length control protein FliK [Candidatus Accumulibacter vicinus]KFB66948.1 MAG: Flagellar hook-length control protein FliK [Candidatus Accumulibacter vicinus]